MATTADNAPGWLAIPGPVRSLFNLFPLHVYDSEPLPCRAPDRLRTRPALYVFTSSTSGSSSSTDHPPSPNPSCLRYQTILRIAGVSVDLVSSSNHASPSGALPLLLPPSGDSSSSRPHTGNDILRYAVAHASRPIATPDPTRLDAYRSLIATSIRPAWLHALYINTKNTPLLRDIYIPPSPAAPFLTQTLRTAATAEILRTTRRETISVPQLLADMHDALDALSTLLDHQDWFSADDSPGPFDADVFAYTWLIQDASWPDHVLASCLREYPNLVAHSERLYRRCWAQGEKAMSAEEVKA